MKITSASFTLEQEEDCCGSIGHDVQHLTLETADGGGGIYYLLKTERWSFNDIHEFTAAIKQLMDKME